ncbi:Rrf2 family transcriptional regulator [Virgibacillus ihumii]|uniref:Rrf2 family transcriptional regulator n=1 Tax=Virgibacillus ihumii TaxID=2686091 RepID=UPI00157C013B|nr:Rrf2 family transcriptional regulator [Virgibacillus ihumii]
MKNSRFAVAVHILALTYSQSRDYLTSEFIASSVNTNAVVIRRISGMLKKAGLLTSQAGIPGVGITKDPAEITLLDVYKAVDESGQSFAVHENPNPNCLVGGRIQDTLEKKFAAAQQAMENELANQTLADVMEDLFEKGSIN